MAYLEEVSTKWHDSYFVDLFVRPSNNVAVGFYKQLGYQVYRSVTGYYSSPDGVNEDALDMRKSMPKDETGELSKPLNKSISPNELEY
jgi:N-terminal acetyltransferase B complex catalytic subunit